MNARVTLATTRRVLGQLRNDRRSVAMMVVVPALMLLLMRYVFGSARAFQAVAPSLIAVFPFIVMFLVTSVATLRERSGGTLERLMTMPVARLDLLVGYALAFGVCALVQVAVVCAISLALLGLTVAGSAALLVLVAVLDALLGMALGLAVSAFARTEFQAVQFMPLVVAPQLLIGGLFAPREHMTLVLRWASDVMPLSYAMDAMKLVAGSATVDGELIRDIVIVAACTTLALLAGAATLRRQTP
jgi:ABC-2 type transport system permease protein